MLTTANHLKQVKKIKIKEDQLIGLRESYDVSIKISITGECTSLTVNQHPDRSIATESRLRQGLRWLVTSCREVLYCMITPSTDCIRHFAMTQSPENLRLLDGNEVQRQQSHPGVSLPPPLVFTQRP